MMVIALRAGSGLRGPGVVTTLKGRVLLSLEESRVVVTVDVGVGVTKIGSRDGKEMQGASRLREQDRRTRGRYVCISGGQDEDG